jgi:hypothetical protein
MCNALHDTTLIALSEFGSTELDTALNPLVRPKVENVQEGGHKED